MPGCTSFASAPCQGEVMIPENKGILPELSVILRRESLRQNIAVIPGHLHGRHVVQEVRGARPGVDGSCFQLPDLPVCK